MCSGHQNLYRNQHPIVLLHLKAKFNHIPHLSLKLSHLLNRPLHQTHLLISMLIVLANPSNFSLLNVFDTLISLNRGNQHILYSHFRPRKSEFRHHSTKQPNLLLVSLDLDRQVAVRTSAYCRAMEVAMFH